MPYTLNKTNGTILTDVLDNSVDRTTTDLAFVGKNTPNYGEYFNENFVKLLENFANSDQPRAPLKGQLWYDTSEEKLKIYNGVEFKEFARPQVASSEPVLEPGDIWINNEKRQLYFNDGNGTRLAGPIYTFQQGISGHEVITVIDTNGATRVLVKLKISNMLMGVYSSANFTPNYNIGDGKILSSEGFTGEIVKGFNPVNNDFKFNVTVKNAENLVDAFGVPVNVNNFVQTVGDSDVNGRLSITGNNTTNLLDIISKPLILGYANNLTIEVQKQSEGETEIYPVIFRSNLTDQDLSLTVRNTDGFKDAVYVDASAERVGVYNTDPLATLDINGDVNFRQNIVTNQSSIDIINTTATTVNLAGAATNVNIGSATGDTTVNNNLVVEKDVMINGGDLNASTEIFNLINTTTNTLNIGQAANAINIGKGTGAVNFANDVNVSGTLGITGDILIDSVFIRDNKISSTGTTTDLNLGAFDGNIILNNIAIAEENLVLNRELVFDGLGIISVPVGFSRSFELLNENVSTILFGGEANRIDIGNFDNVGDTNVLNNLNVRGRIEVGPTGGGPAYLDSSGNEINLFNDQAKTINFGRDSNEITIGRDVTTDINIYAGTTYFDGNIDMRGGNISVIPGVTQATVFNTYISSLTVASSAGNIYLGGDNTLVRVGQSLKVGSIEGEVEITSQTETGTINRGLIKVGENTAFFSFLPTNVLNVDMVANAERVEIGSGTIPETDPTLYQPSVNTGVDLTSQLPVVIMRNNLLVRDKLLIPNLDTAASSGGAGLIFKNTYQELEASTYIRSVGNSLAIAGDVIVTGSLVGSDLQGIAKIPKARITQLNIVDEIISEETEIDLFKTFVTTLNIGGAANGTINLGANTSIVRVPGAFLPAWKTVTSTLNPAKAGDKLLIDTTNFNVSVYLPPTPSAGDTVTFVDKVGYATRTLFIYRNGNKINAVDSDLNITTPGKAFTLVYTGATRGWCYDNA